MNRRLWRRRLGKDYFREMLKKKKNSLKRYCKTSGNQCFPQDPVLKNTQNPLMPTLIYKLYGLTKKTTKTGKIRTLTEI